MQDPAYGLRRINLPRTPVNKGRETNFGAPPSLMAIVQAEEAGEGAPASAPSKMQLRADTVKSSASSPAPHPTQASDASRRRAALERLDLDR
jgi:hypothetical protein